MPAILFSAVLAIAAGSFLAFRQYSPVQAAVLACVWVAAQMGLATWIARSRRLALVSIWFAPAVVWFVRDAWPLVVAAVCLAFAVSKLAGLDESERPSRFFEGAALHVGLIALALDSVVVASLGLAVAFYRIVRVDLLARLNWTRGNAVLMAASLTAVGLMPPIRQWFKSDTESEGASTNIQRVSKRDDLFSAVVLKSNRPQHVVLVAPPSRTKGRGKGTPKPLEVPFSGEYWMSYTWLRRPPASALVEYGDPEEFKFTAADFSRLLMEAHQPLAMSLDMRDWAQVEVEVSSTDTMPETVSMALALRNTAEPESRELPLGESEVPRLGRLRFDVPPGTQARYFNELVMTYRLRPPRSHRSANIAIGRFTFVPRQSR